MTPIESAVKTLYWFFLYGFIGWGVEVVYAAEGVYQLAEVGAVELYGHGVDGEVAAVLVVLERAVLHDRLARVVAVALAACPDKLYLHVAVLHLCRAEVAEY